MTPINKSPSKPNPNKTAQFLKKNGISIVLGITFITMLVNPDAKSWVLQKLMLTGIFNANIEQITSVEAMTADVDFDFIDENGIMQNTSSLRGKVVFINFWASWCGPCRAEFPSIEILYSKFKNNPNVAFVMINLDDDVSKGIDYLKKENFTLPFHQAASSIPDAIYTGSLPTTVVLDKKGVIRFKHENFANYASEKFIKELQELVQEN